MPEFKDAKGRKWELTIDAPAIKRVRESHDVNLTALGDEQPWSRLDEDLVLLVDVLWTVLEQQAVGKQIDEQGFAGGLIGDGLANASLALVSAVADFFPAERRSLLLAMNRRNRTLMAAGMSRATSRIEDEKTGEKMEAKVRTAVDEAIEKAIQ